MNITRRGFLELLAGVTLVGCAKGEDTQSQKKKASRTPSGLSPQEEMIVKYFLPMLKRNEDAEKEDNEPANFQFYCKSEDKVTVGYGVNIEANSSLLDDVSVYHNGKKLSDQERKTFLDTAAKKDNDTLAQYTITAEDAEYLTKKAMVAELRNTARILSDANGKTFLYDLPFCMQALAFDICYNVGQGHFKEYKKFKAALLARDYDKALKESLVYTNKKKKTTNKRREWAKKRLLDIMRLVQKNSSTDPKNIRQLLQQDYDANTPYSRRLLNRHTKFSHEISIATAEWKCIQNSLGKAKKLQQAKAAPQKAAAEKVTPQKQSTISPRARTGR